MRTKLATYALVGTLGLTGVAGGALLAPAVSYAATSTTDAVSDRVTSLKDALAGLVTAGTITQSQADEVATTLAETMPEPGGHHGRGGGRHGADLAAAADALGLTQDELRAQAEAGKTLAEVAAAQGVSEDDLVAALVKAEKAELAAAVTDGRLTQAQADARAADLQTRITDSLDDPICGPGGGGDHDGDGPAGPAPQSSTPTTPSPAATSSAA